VSPYGMADQHWHGLVLSEQVLLDGGEPAETNPAFLGIASAVQEIENRKLAAGIPVVIGWNVYRHVAESPRLSGAVRPELDGAVRDVLQLVEARRIAGDLEIAPVDGATGPHVGVRLVDAANSVHEEHIPVNVGFERTDGDRPKTGRVLLHRNVPHAGLILGGARGLWG